MTLEEALLKISDLESQNKSILENKNEILGELKKLKNANKEHNIDDLIKTNNDLENKVNDLEKDNKLLKNEFEKTSKILADKDGKLRQTLVSDGLTKALIENGIDKKHLEVIKGFYESKVTLDDSYNAVIEGKSLGDFAKDFLTSDSGKIYAEFNPTGGNGANGSGYNGGASEYSKYFEVGGKDFNLTKQAEIMKSNPTLYNQLKK